MTTEWKEITDPEELFRLKREGWEIEVRRGILPLEKWTGVDWERWWNFRASPRQPKMKKVKLLAYLSHSYLQHAREDTSDEIPEHWIRQPHLDLEGEVPE